MSHQPPPDARRHSGVKPMGSYLTITEGGNSEAQINGENCIYVNEHGRVRPYYLRRCKKKRLETKMDIINSLPDDIMLDILIRFPAQDIYGITRLVCRDWYKMIRTHKFVYAHLQRSAHGILIQNRASILKSQLSFMSVQQGQIEITRLSYEPGHIILCSCNGLVLESERGNHYALRVTNPATMQHFNLPPIRRSIAFTTSAIAYAAATMEYKVIRMYYSTSEDSKISFCCAILTVGVDSSWRPVRIQHLSPKANECLRFGALTTEGFVHWPQRDTCVLSLNIETEVITEYSVPPCCGEGLDYYYFPAVRYLALLIKRGRFSWELWEMEPESGKWTKVTSIDLEAQCTIEHLIHERDTSFKLFSFVYCRLQPIGWLKYRQVLVFYVGNVNVYQEFKRREGFRQQPRLCMAYNVHSKGIELIELDSIPDVFLAHRNGLVWLDGC